METIEVVAAALHTVVGPVAGEFAAFVRPVVRPKLSTFCQALTSIRQEDVDATDRFSPVLQRFEA